MNKTAVLIFFVFAAYGAARATTCESLKNLVLQNGRIVLAIREQSGSFKQPNMKTINELPPFCRVSATLTPSDDSMIMVEVWLPLDGWNGKLEGVGNGGFAGSPSYGGLANGLRLGFAVVSSDMGTSPSTGTDGDSLIGHPQKWIDWGSRATHEMTIAAKEIVRVYYSRAPQHSYFVGCSTGGQQGLMEAQRYPDDYEGIVAGAPANNRTRLHVAILWNFMTAKSDPNSNLSAVKLALISQAVLKACGKQKVVPSDEFLSRPMECRWDPGRLQCKSEDSSTCLTAKQVEIVRAIYGGPTNPVTNAAIYPGLLRGSELAWDSFMPEGEQAPYGSLFKWVFGPSWNWRHFDFNSDVKSVDAVLASDLNATNPNLEAFKQSGHKLIVFHGWADALVPSQESVEYYRNVEKEQVVDAAHHHRSAAEETQTFYRVFMIPGMYHCGGGPGLNTLDALPALEDWVEKGNAPMQLTAVRIDNGKTIMKRPVCPFPQVTSYSERGDPGDAGTYVCISDKEHSGKRVF